jgi:hypothetical protein
MQVFDPFVRQSGASSRACNIVTSPLATLNLQADRVLATDKLHRVGIRSLRYVTLQKVSQKELRNDRGLPY